MDLRISLATAIALISASAARAQPVAAYPPSQPLEQSVRQFLEAFINPEQEANEQAGFFTEGARYYGFGPTSRMEIARDIRHYAKRWPWRSYRLARIEYIRPDPGSDDIFVSYVVDYELAGPGRTAHGQANYGALITDMRSMPRISLIMEKVLPEHQENAPSSGADH